MIKRTNSNDTDFHSLVKELDADLSERYGALQELYSPYNKIEDIETVVIAYVEDQPAGCACFKFFEQDIVEVKRMFVTPALRGKGIGAALLGELENWAGELGYGAIILELGNRQPAAFRLYQQQGFRIIPNYGQYQGMEASICMKKELSYR